MGESGTFEGHPETEGGILWVVPGYSVPKSNRRQETPRRVTTSGGAQGAKPLLLREHRIKRKVRLEDIAEATKISRRFWKRLRWASMASCRVACLLRVTFASMRRPLGLRRTRFWRTASRVSENRSRSGVSRAARRLRVRRSGIDSCRLGNLPIVREFLENSLGHSISTVDHIQIKIL